MARDNEDTFPTVPKELLDKLAELFPDRCPRLKDTDREVWFNSGAASVVGFLRAKYDEQQER